MLRDLADAIGRHRPGSVVAWHPAVAAAATLVLASTGDHDGNNDDDDAEAAGRVPPSRTLLRTRRSGVDEVASGRSTRPLTTADVEAAAARLSSMRQTVVVCARPDDPWFDVLAGDADAVVVPVVDDDAVSRAIALTDLVAAGRLTVVRPGGARGRTTEVRRRLGEAGIRTVLDVTHSVDGLDGLDGLDGPTGLDGVAGLDVAGSADSDSADADWSRAAAVILRPRPTGRGTAFAEPALSFESTTATLRARSHGDRSRAGGAEFASHGSGRGRPRRRSVAAPLATAAVVLVVALGASVALFSGGGDPHGNGVTESARTDAASVSVAEAVLDGPGVIARFDDLYYRDRDADAAAALWDLPAGVDRAAMVADLQSSIDAVQQGTTHSLDIRPTSAADVYDAVLTLTTPDGRQFDFDQQFVVRGSDRGFTIVRKIECSAACSAPTESDTETGR